MSKERESRRNSMPKNSEIISIGNCVRIKNSNKTFQILGINEKKTICWIREWPLNYQPSKTFELSLNQIILSTSCSSLHFDFEKR